MYAMHSQHKHFNSNCVHACWLVIMSSVQNNRLFTAARGSLTDSGTACTHAIIQNEEVNDYHTCTEEQHRVQ